MIRRIDLFMPPKGPYNFLRQLTHGLAAGLQRSGAVCRILEGDYYNPKAFLDRLFADPPDCTLSFNGLLPDEEGNFLCDMIKIPHVACLVDDPQHFIQLTHSPNTIITTTDRAICDFFESTHFDRALFMPLAVDRELILPPNQPQNRSIDLLMMSSFIDAPRIRQHWFDDFPESLATALDEAAEMVLSGQDVPYIQALAQTIDLAMKRDASLDPHKYDFVLLLDELEGYINGQARLEVASSIEGVTLHICGQNSEEWLRYKPKGADWVALPPVEYSEISSLFRRTKIVLNCVPALCYGVHERIFLGMASGAVVLTNGNSYIHELLKVGEEILVYPPKSPIELNGLIQNVLQDPARMQKMGQRAIRTIAMNHTWDHRAAVLLNELAPVVASLQLAKGKS